MAKLDVKVGDLLALPERFGSSLTLMKVDRLTATTAVCGTSRFKLDDGMMIGSGGGGRWDFRQYARCATPSDLLNVRIRRAAIKLKDFKVSADNLEAVEALLATATPATTTGD